MSIPYVYVIKGDRAGPPVSGRIVRDFGGMWGIRCTSAEDAAEVLSVVVADGWRATLGETADLPDWFRIPGCY